MKKAATILGSRCSHGTNSLYDYKTAFTQSIFCLVAKTERLFQINFIEALAANCIPVIYADNIVLPFSEVEKQLNMIDIKFIISDFFSSDN